MANIWTDFLDFFKENYEVIEAILLISVLIIILSIVLKLIKSYLVKKVKTKKQMSNVTVFTDMLFYVLTFFFIVIVVAYYTRLGGEFGFLAGLLTVAIGWALQKPISGVVAWLIIITRRPFAIGDRVILSDIKGDITNISLTHIFLDEVGGTISGEEESRRTVMVPNSVLFERELINYTGNDDYILDEVKMTVTYESDIDKAERFLINSVKLIMKENWNKFPKKISTDSVTRLDFKDSGVEITVRYNSIAKNRNQISTDIRREAHRMVTLSKDVEFAYPHTEVLFRDKNKK